MTQNPKRLSSIVFWISICFLAICYFLLKYTGPLYVEKLFTSQKFNLLNQLSAVEGQHSFLTYQGYIMERWIGPLCALLSAALLILISARFLTNARGWVFGLTIFLFLMITKAEVLTYPAYGEQNTANMVEALYLLATNFNYVDLAREPNFAEGGVKTYLLSIFPGFLAVLMKLTPSAQSFFIVTHTIIFALSAASS